MACTNYEPTGVPVISSLPGTLRGAVLSLGLALMLVETLGQPAHAENVADFYKGKTVTVAVGTTTGGGYDLYARMLSRFLSKHIPGQPTIVTQNMPGAGGLRLATYLYNAAAKDGTFVGTFSRSVPTIPLFSPGSTFDGTQFTWLGSIASDTSLCISGTASAVKTWNDMLTKPVVMGGQSVGSDSDIYARLYTNVFGAKIKLVSGYPGTNEITLAMERGEVDGICGLSLSTILVAHPEWIGAKSVNVLIQAGLKVDPAIPNVPMATDLTDDPEKKQILYLHLAPQGMARPFAAPPGIPASRKAALIKAFDDTMNDSEFLAAAAQTKMPVSPMAAGEIDTLLKQLYATPNDIVIKAAQTIAEEK